MLRDTIRAVALVVTVSACSVPSGDEYASGAASTAAPTTPTPPSGGASDAANDGAANAAAPTSNVCPALTGVDVTQPPYNVKTDGSDVTTALQDAINALSTAGKIALLPNGTFTISKTIGLPANTHLQGSGASIVKVGATFDGIFLVSANGAKVIVDRVVFDSANREISALAIGGGSDNLTVTNNTFQNSLTATNSYAGEVNFYDTTTGANISHNAFKNIGPSSYSNTDIQNDYAPVGIYIDVNATVNSAALDDNTFDTVAEPMHAPASSQTTVAHANDLEIARNMLRGVHRISIEMQISGSNLTVKDNYINGWIDPFWGSFGLSIASSGAKNVVITGNIINGVGGTPAGWWGYGLEAGGQPVTVTGNHVYGFPGQTNSVGLISNHSSTMAESFAHDNVFCGTKGDAAQYEQSDPTTWDGPSPGDVITPNQSFDDCSDAPPLPDPPKFAGPCTP